MKALAVLGSTGSIGVNTLDLVRRFPKRFTIKGLAAGRNIRLLAEQAREFSPIWVSVGDKEKAPLLRKLLGRKKTEVVCGEEGAVQVSVAREVDVVVAAIVGSAGLVPTLAALQAGKEVALANKEALVMAGELFVKEAKKRALRLLPVDSEHSAIFQCLQGNRREEVDKIILTASGGPFLKTPLPELKRVTVAQALRHPNWKMGPKITIDSATMINKGLEVIEARWLFDMAPSQVAVVIHPQSIVHSMVQYRDGSILAQMGIPDMRIPIAYALSCPQRLQVNLPPLDLARKGELTFLPVEKKRYPGLQLAYDALAAGGAMPAVLNAANEAAVAAFLDERIAFQDIHKIIDKTMGCFSDGGRDGLPAILEIDRWARRKAAEFVAKS